jgi:pilus assembly protein Flp/PilA
MASSKKWECCHMKSFLARFAYDESGATAIEYGLIAAIIGVGIVAALTQVKTGLTNVFQTKIAGELNK